MITPSELERLLDIVVRGDRRTTSPADVDYWAAMAAEGRWTYATAMRALVIFRTEHPGEWLDPAHLTAIIRQARHRGAETFVEPDPPGTLPPDQYPAWKRARLAEHIDRVLDAWADGAPMPVTVAGAAELTGTDRPQLEAGLNTSTCPPELRAQVARDFERIGRERSDRHRPAVALPHRMAGDPARRAAARAELAGREPAPMPEPATEADGEATA
jgi:hypothetical protein